MSKELQFLMQLFAIHIAVFLIINMFDRSDTSALPFEEAAMIPEILHLYSPNLAIKLTSFLQTVSAEKFINQYKIHVRRLLQWLAKHAKNIAIFQSLTKTEQSELSERNPIGQSALQFYREIVSIPIQP